MPLKIAHIVAEYAGLAQTGGLADAVAALTKEMARSGHDVRIFMPRYADLDEARLPLEPVAAMRDCSTFFGETEYRFSFVSSRAPDSDATLYLIDCPQAYDRPGIYGGDADEHLRFALLARAALEGCQRLTWSPDIMHCHDWHAGLLPWFAKNDYGWDPLLAGARTVLTVHNLAYQGVFSSDSSSELSSDGEGIPLHPTEGDHQSVNFLATGLRFADAVTTVSPTYAREIQTAEHGMGLEGVLGDRSDEPVGILNGVDYENWDPSLDPLIPANYSPSDLSGKKTCRRQLLAEHALLPEPAGPVLGVVSRLAHQKGLELIVAVLPGILEAEDIRLVVLGTGDATYEKRFSELAERFPEKVAFRRTFDLQLAHQIEAGSDIFLMPSRFEPCGLNQMYSLKYGTVPVVHKTGGLADTVEPFDPSSGRGTGFLFSPFREESFRSALLAALEAFSDPAAWQRLVANGMSADYSWSRQVEAYLGTYRRLLS